MTKRESEIQNAFELAVSVAHDFRSLLQDDVLEQCAADPEFSAGDVLAFVERRAERYKRFVSKQPTGEVADVTLDLPDENYGHIRPADVNL